jgi:NAD(P)-dependent dehydrogenase (short-subunit alcohol dehydrogenase family)
MKRLHGKRALVTGGTIGVGLETARLFLAEGAQVAITGSEEARLKAAAIDLGGDVLTIRADAWDVAAPQSISTAVRGTFGGLDVAFINAGVCDVRPLESWDETAFDYSIAANLKGPFFLVQALLPIFVMPASIILNASINGRIGLPSSSVYAATKAGLVSLARTLSGELIGRGIRVNAISPGPVATAWDDGFALPGALLDELVSQIPAGRRGRTREIAQAVVYLASDDGAFTVGSEFVIDGGMSNL